MDALVHFEIFFLLRRAPEVYQGLTAFRCCSKWWYLNDNILP